VEKRKNILVLTYWSYKDALIQTYTLPYIRIFKKYLPEGSRIYLVTLEQDVLKIPSAEHKKIKTDLAKENIYLKSFQYRKFGVMAFIDWIVNFMGLTSFCQRKKIKVIHAWCTPAGAIGYVMSKLTGIPLIIDSYEPHAEPMAESNTWPPNGLAFNILFKLEKWQSRRAKAVIACVSSMQDYAREKFDVEFDRFFVKPACVNLDLFSEQNVKQEALLSELGLNDKLVAVYAGKFGGSYYGKEVFDFFKIAADFWGDKFKVLLLNNHTNAEIEEFAIGANLDPELIVKRFVPHHEIANYIGLADFAMTPFIPVPSKRYGSPIKNGEYWALGLPIVISPNISDDSAIIEEKGIGSILLENTKEKYLQSVQEIDGILTKHTRSELFAKIRAVAVEYRNFDIANEVYSKLYKQSL